MDKERKVEEIARNFTEIPTDMKDKIAWYLLGRQEEQERQKEKSA